MSEHFSMRELTYSNTANRLGIENTPNKDEVIKLELLMSKLELIREGLDMPIYISSGFRSKELNRALNGSKTSSHMLCEAVDIDLGNTRDNDKLFKWVMENMNFDQLINETHKGKNWIHIGFGERMRNQIMTYDGTYKLYNK